MVTRRNLQGIWKKHKIDLINAQSAKAQEDNHPQSITSIRKANTGTRGQDAAGTGDGPEDMVGASHPTSFTKLFPGESSLTKVDLICSWSADVLASGNAKINGEHQLRSVAVRPAKKANGCPITISAIYPPDVVHNFDERGPPVSQLVSIFFVE